MTDDLVRRPDDEQDDLTLVYMWAYKMAEKKYKSRIEKLEAALRFAAEVISSIDSFDSDHPEEALEWIMQESAALGEKKDV
jgi:hypothetical protein